MRLAQPTSYSIRLLVHNSATPPKRPSPLSSEWEIAGERLLSDEEWMQNRLTVLLAQNKLIQGAMAMARAQEFHLSTVWLHQRAGHESTGSSSAEAGRGV